MPNCNKVSTNEVLQKIMSDAEEWRNSIFKSFSSSSQTLAFHLCCLAEEKTRLEEIRGTETYTLQHALIRQNLFSLEWALRSIKLPDQTSTSASRIRDKWNVGIVPNLIKILEDMSYFCHLRDLLITTNREGYVLNELGENYFEFIDPPNWKGGGDYKARQINHLVEDDAVENMKIPRNFNDFSLDGSHIDRDFPHNIKTSKFDSEDFWDVWSYLFRLSAHSKRSNSRMIKKGKSVMTTQSYMLPILRGKTPLITEISRNTGVEREIAKRILTWITFNSKTLRKFTLFHCPVVDLNCNLFLILPNAIICSHVPTTFLRLLAHYDKRAFDSASTSIEKMHLKKIIDHISGEKRILDLGMKFRTKKEEIELDLVEFNPDQASLNIVQSKFFIRPDSVSEVYSANDTIVKASRQIRQNKVAIENSDLLTKICSRLGISQEKVQNIEYFIVPTNFTGSDFLEIDGEIKVLPEEFCLMEPNKGKSLNQIWKEYQKKWNSLDEDKNIESQKFHFELAGMRIIAPGFAA